MTTLVWLQRELRIDELPALQSALENDGSVIVAYFHDDRFQVGQANSAWLAQSLLTLKQDYERRGGELWLVAGDFSSSLDELIERFAIKQINYSYQVGEPFVAMQQIALQVCQKHQIALQPFYSEFLFQPEQMLNLQNKPYLVFTPFYKSLSKKRFQITPLSATQKDLSATANIAVPKNHAVLPESLQRLLDQPWAQKVMAHWSVGEKQAWQHAEQFIANHLESYLEERDFPSIAATSCLSAPLHFGELTLKSLYFYMLVRIENGQLNEEFAMGWFRQLVWKEFARHLLYWFPQLQTEPFQTKYAQMQWDQRADIMMRWQQGLTGIPIIDAGMRELWQTGVMHNRVRMLVASLLTKNLNQHWLAGKQWFDDTLVDADPANNIMGWQWVAGCGVDAAPYYRLFNPVTQSLKFDAKGRYLRKWLPELAALSDKAIHEPWNHAMECQMKGITLGEQYPHPMVDLQQSRKQHLERVELLKQINATS
ncbi:cryptochrome/photolyase family protein [Thiomicrorhabdus sediminis]|uniref:Deoxyribodipyrimidine photo-lyase n=1 Tax=Thiomicrorhabdus sediminis TaxID=2580412 RepID=A0A4P9K4Q2_9GAMM|nr:deoxyribodipyrimidine photo-lyase [Thiomicrorhabdus sediminis]QCU89922.1 deoxyribodipyrimidine photo-lyase [Thiomicrorhabdus sediminis]